MASQVQPLSSSHTTIRLKGMGIKKLEGPGSGDHFVTLKIKMPQSLSSKQQALIQEYAETEANTPGTIFGVNEKKEMKGEWSAFLSCSLEALFNNIYTYCKLFSVTAEKGSG